MIQFTGAAGGYCVCNGFWDQDLHLVFDLLLVTQKRERERQRANKIPVYTLENEKPLNGYAIYPLDRWFFHVGVCSRGSSRRHNTHCVWAYTTSYKTDYMHGMYSFLPSLIPFSLIRRIPCITE